MDRFQTCQKIQKVCNDVTVSSAWKSFGKFPKILDTRFVQFEDSVSNILIDSERFPICVCAAVSSEVHWVDCVTFSRNVRSIGKHFIKYLTFLVRKCIILYLDINRRSGKIFHSYGKSLEISSRVWKENVVMKAHVYSPRYFFKWISLYNIIFCYELYALNDWKRKLLWKERIQWQKLITWYKQVSQRSCIFWLITVRIYCAVFNTLFCCPALLRLTKIGWYKNKKKLFWH